MTFRPAFVLLSACCCVVPTRAFAWGCEGHRAITILAERLLTPTQLARMRDVLAASPIDPAIKPYCQPLPADPLAEASTWADDNRALDPTTAGWHFINFPRTLGENISDYTPYCRGGNCVIDSIVRQFKEMTTSSDAKARGNALRYVLHFVGDLHQPLHVVTNGDRGGNCLPVTYNRQRPQEDAQHDFRPNLHAVWDDGMIRQLMVTANLKDSIALADYVSRNGKPRSTGAQIPDPDLVAGWARESNELARTVAYAWLPIKVPTERANTYSVATCDDNNHVSRRLVALNERIDDVYESAAVSVILGQLRVASERLASVLKAAFPDSH